MDTNEKIRKFFAKYKLSRCKAKDILIHMSDEPGSVYYLNKGFVKMNTILSNGNELTLNIFKPGSFFPMTWAIADVPNNYLFQTITETSFHKAPKSDVLNFLANNPDVLLDLTKRILTGLDGVLTNITHIIFGNASSRVSSALLLCSGRFGKRNNEDKIVLDIRLTHQDVANIAGLTRETTSIVLSNLKKDKIISQNNGKMVMDNIEELKNRAQVEKPLTNPINVI